MLAVRKILCAIDFSEPSREALHFAAELAKRFGASLTLFHAYTLPGYVLPEGMVVAGPEVMTDLLDQLKKTMTEWRADVTARGVQACDTTTVQGAAPAEIVRFAREGGYDLIVVGTHGRTGLKHALLGSVAEKVLRRAPCPVLTVRPADHRLEEEAPAP